MFGMRMRLKRNYFCYITGAVIISILVILYLIEHQPKRHTDISDKIARSEAEYRSKLEYERELLGKELPVTEREDSAPTNDLNDTSSNSLKVYVVEEHHEGILLRLYTM